MGTANFYTKNAGFTYACEFKDGQEYDDLVADLRMAFKSAAEDPKQQAFAAFEETRDAWESDGLRSYPGRIIARVETAAGCYRDFRIALSADIIVRSGYSAGASLDYGLRVNGHAFEAGGLDGFDGLDALRDIFDDGSLPEKRRQYNRRLARQWLGRTGGKFTGAIEAVFRQHSVPLRLVGRASNGEAFYEKA